MVALRKIEGEPVGQSDISSEDTDPYPEILDEQILRQQGSYRRIKQYLLGWHPDLGRLHMGWQGQETIVEKDVFIAKGRIRVVEGVNGISNFVMRNLN